MDKYYMLIRRFVNASFRSLMRHHWDSSSLQTYNDILTAKGGGPLWYLPTHRRFSHTHHTPFLPNVENPSSPDDNRIPSSLKYHLADIYLEELDKVLAWDSEAGDERPPRAPIDTLIAPFLTLVARTTSNHTFDRVMSVVLEPLVQSLAPAGSPEPPSKKKRRLLGTEMSFVADNSCMSSSLPTTTAAAAADADKPALHQALLKQVFSVASERDTRDSNRRRLYKFWKSNLEDDDDDQGAPRDVDGS